MVMHYLVKLNVQIHRKLDCIAIKIAIRIHGSNFVFIQADCKIFCYTKNLISIQSVAALLYIIKLVSLVSEYTHLGHVISATLDDKGEILPPANMAINVISLKTTFVGLHFWLRKYRCIFNHFYVIRIESHRVR